MLDVYMLYALPSIYNKALSTFKRILKARIRVFGRLVLVCCANTLVTSREDCVLLKGDKGFVSFSHPFVFNS